MLILAATALFRAASLDLPLDRDEGEYATLAWLWRGGQGLPYRDFLEQKPPLAPVFYAAAQAAFGHTPEGLRWAALLWMLATAAALYAWLRAHLGSVAALWGGLFFALFSSGARIQGLSANTELWVTLPMLGCLFMLSHASGPRWIVAGCFAGLAGLVKQSALPALLIFPLLMPGGSRLGAAARMCLGAALPWGVTLLAFSAAGAGAAFWECLVAYNLRYAGDGLSGSWRRLLGALYHQAPEQGLLWILALAGFWRAWRKNSEEELWPRRLLLAWWLASALGAALGGRWYPHYFQILCAPQSSLAGLFLADSSRAWLRPVAFASCLAAFAAVNAPVWTAADGAERSERIFGLKNFGIVPRAAEHLRDRTPEGSRLFVWGAEAEAYFLSRRPPATRFLFHYPFTGEAPSWPGGEEEILRALEDPSTAAVLALPMDPTRPFERKMGELIQRRFSLRVDIAPPFVLGLRKR